MVRTQVSVTVPDDVVEEARGVLAGLADGWADHTQTARDAGPDGTATLVRSVPGDVRDQVRAQLEGLTVVKSSITLIKD